MTAVRLIDLLMLMDVDTYIEIFDRNNDYFTGLVETFLAIKKHQTLYNNRVKAFYFSKICNSIMVEI